jgi:hypothetical protein
MLISHNPPAKLRTISETSKRLPKNDKKDPQGLAPAGLDEKLKISEPKTP